MTALIAGLTIYFWQKSVNEKVINNLEQEITALKTGEPTRGKFTYYNFSLTYPDDWVLLDMSSNEDFPLKERLDFFLYNLGKVIALSKNGLYLIVIIEQESEGRAGGIFLNDNYYDEFISDKDRVLIGNSIFYLTKSHSDIASLLESHMGAYMWSALAEYLPNKETEPGVVFKGYENVIKRNGYSYNFIITSKEGGATDPQLQGEIIDILETITW